MNALKELMICFLLWFIGIKNDPREARIKKYAAYYDLTTKINMIIIKLFLCVDNSYVLKARHCGSLLPMKQMSRVHVKDVELVTICFSPEIF